MAAVPCLWVLQGEGRNWGREMLEPLCLEWRDQREPVGWAGCQSEAQGNPHVSALPAAAPEVRLLVWGQEARLNATAGRAGQQADSVAVLIPIHAAGGGGKWLFYAGIKA